MAKSKGKGGDKDKKKEKPYVKLSELPERAAGNTKVTIMNNNLISIEDGFFDVNAILETILAWMSDHKYLPTRRSPTEKVKPMGRTFETKIEAFRAADRYFKYHIKVNVFATKTSDVKIKGSDVTIKQGQLSVFISSHLELDYEHSMDRTVFQQFLKNIYETFFSLPKIIKHSEQLRAESGSLQSVLKDVITRYTKL